MSGPLRIGNTNADRANIRKQNKYIAKYQVEKKIRLNLNSKMRIIKLKKKIENVHTV